jgi:hypothetical protein
MGFGTYKNNRQFDGLLQKYSRKISVENMCNLHEAWKSLEVSEKLYYLAKGFGKYGIVKDDVVQITGENNIARTKRNLEEASRKVAEAAKKAAEALKKK